MTDDETELGGEIKSHFMTLLYWMILGKSYLPFCGYLNAILAEVRFFFWKITRIATSRRRRRIYSGSNEVTSPCVLRAAEAGRCVRAAERDGSVCYCTSKGGTPAQKFPVETEMNLPSREECEGWDQARVALFMCQVSRRKKRHEQQKTSGYWRRLADLFSHHSKVQYRVWQKPYPSQAQRGEIASVGARKTSILELITVQHVNVNSEVKSLCLLPSEQNARMCHHGKKAEN